MRVSVIIPAAGSSRRFQSSQDAGLTPDRSKLDEDLGGRPVLHRAVELFSNYTNPDVDIAQIIVAGPADDDAWDAFQLRHGDKLALLGVTLCRGGKERRTQSVAEALKQVDGSTTHIAVHDAARPATPVELLDRIFKAAQQHPAVIPAIEVTDTLKRVSEADVGNDDIDPLDAILGDAGKTSAKGREVVETVDRASLVSVQTPQVFDADLLRRAYESDDASATDDAQMVERLGEPVIVVDGDARNLKITVPADLPITRSIMGLKPPKERAAHKRF